MRNFCLFICISLAVAYWSGLPLSLGLSAQSQWYTRLTYMLLHGNVIHLLLNIYAIMTMLFLCRVKLLQIIAAFVIAIAVPYCGEVPLVGISTFIYALLGMIIMDSDSWKYLLLTNLAVISFSVVLNNISFIAHIDCFALGVIVGFISSRRHGRNSCRR